MCHLSFFHSQQRTDVRLSEMLEVLQSSGTRPHKRARVIIIVTLHTSILGAKLMHLRLNELSLRFTFSLPLPFRRKTIQEPFNSAWNVKRLPAHSNTTAASGSPETRSFCRILKWIFLTFLHGNMVTLPKHPRKPIALV